MVEWDAGGVARGLDPRVDGAPILSVGGPQMGVRIGGALNLL